MDGEKMAHLWLKDEADGWAVFPLNGACFDVSGRLPRAAGTEAGAGALLWSVTASGERMWLLLAPRHSGVSVNGLPLAAGIRVLADRDEIRAGAAGLLFFSTEMLARMEAFPGAAQKMFCPRCRLELEKDAQAVQCPACGVWHHQTEELPCWTYAGACALCPQPTDLSVGFRWMPEEA